MTSSADLFLAGSIAKGIAKGGLYVADKATTRAAPYAWRYMRDLMQEKGFIKAGEEGHHWFADAHFVRDLLSTILR